MSNKHGRKVPYIDRIVEIIKKIPFRGIFIYLFNYINHIINYKNKHNKDLKNLYSDQTCFVVGSGISVNDIKLENIKNSKIFICNEFFLHKKLNEFNIDFYTTLEPYYYFIRSKKYHSDILNFYKKIDLKLSNKKIKFFFDSTLKQIIKKNNLFKNEEVRYVSSFNRNFNSKLNNDLSGDFNFSNGALSFMIASSIFLGFKKIILIGCGYTFSPIQEFHFFARPKYEKKFFTLKKFLSEAKLYAKKNNLLFSRYDENEKYYLPIFNSEYKLNNNHYNQIDLKRLSDINNVEIINVIQEGYESKVFNSILSKNLKLNN